ncbi:MAG: ATP-binding protein [Planctomycetaceae bacterium]
MTFILSLRDPAVAKLRPGHPAVVCRDDVGLQLVVDKHQVLQILVNLVKNAKDAFHGGRQTEKRVELRVVCPDRKHVRIEVQDNGCGIHPENLTRIFSFGFTTKGDQGGLGFGLHHSALLAKELGGELHAASDGPGSHVGWDSR